MFLKESAGRNSIYSSPNFKPFFAFLLPLVYISKAGNSSLAFQLEIHLAKMFEERKTLHVCEQRGKNLLFPRNLLSPRREWEFKGRCQTFRKCTSLFQRHQSFCFGKIVYDYEGCATYPALVYGQLCHESSSDVVDPDRKLEHARQVVLQVEGQGRRGRRVRKEVGLGLE